MASWSSRWILAFATLLAFGMTAHAHPLAPSLLEIVEDIPGLASVKWKTPANKVPGERMRPILPQQCRPSTTQAERTVDTAVVRTWQLVCDAPLVDSRVAVDNIASSRANVILRVALADGRVFNTVLTPERASFAVPARETPGEVLRSYFALGVEHILSGFDHLLFVFGLLLLVTNRRQLVSTVTAFTAGHSVTLSLAALGIVAVPSRPVEVLIALSILLVAVELADGNKATLPMLRRSPWAIAFAFGLLHGFGFAGALSDIGLPQGEIPLALLSFNLGIEVGQLAFCASALALYLSLRSLRLSEFTRGKRIAAYFIGTLAAFWMIERAAAGF